MDESRIDRALAAATAIIERDVRNAITESIISAEVERFREKIAPMVRAEVEKVTIERVQRFVNHYDIQQRLVVELKIDR